MQSTGIPMHAQRALNRPPHMLEQKSKLFGFFQNPRPACILDLGHKTCALHDGRLQPMRNKEPFEAKSFYFTEFPSSFECGTLDVSGEKKYSRLVARRQLEQEGRLDHDGALHIYAHHQVEPHLTRIFFQIFDRTAYLSIFQKGENHARGMLIHDPISMLFGLLKTSFGKKDHILIFHSQRALFTLFGSKNKPLFLQKYPLNASTDQGLKNTLQSVETDIDSLSRQGRQFQKIVWIEHLCAHPELHLPALRLPVTVLPMESFDSQKARLWSAVPGILHQLPPKYALGPKHEKRIWPLEKHERLLHSTLLCVVLILIFAIFDVHKQGIHKEHSLQKQIETNQDIQQRINALSKTVVRLEPNDIQSFQEVSSFIKQCEKQSSFLQVWNRLASLQPQGFKLREVKLSADDRQQVIHLSGDIEAHMFEAQQIFSDYMRALKAGGFKVINRTFDINLEKITYQVQAIVS